MWGNTPALDVLKLEQNEGLSYQDDIALLFAGYSYIPCRVIHTKAEQHRETCAMSLIQLQASQMG